MSFSLRMEALDQLGERQGEVVAALRELERQIGSVSFDSSEQESVEAAIRTIANEVDRRLLPFQANSIVREIAEQLKAKAAENIRLRAEHARDRQNQTDDETGKPV